MKVIAYKHEDRVKILVPVEQYWIESGLYESELLQQLKDRFIPEDASDITYLDDTDVPQDRHFRDALDIIDGKLVHNLTKCQDIQLNKLRVIRDEKLKKLDLQKTIAEERGHKDKVKYIIHKKQQLRDLPKTINIRELQDLDLIKNLTHPLLEDN